MGRDGITMIELAVVCWNYATILQLNPTFLNGLHFYQFAICGAKFWITPVAGEQQTIARSNFNRSLLIDGIVPCLSRCEGSLVSLLVADNYQARLNPINCQSQMCQICSAIAGSRRR